MISFILKLFIPFRWLIQKMGADYSQFISIMRLKLTMDGRRINNSPMMGNTRTKTMTGQLFMQAFMGIFFALMVGFIKSPFTFFYLSHTFIMAMMALMIIAEFTTILFDTSENAIIQPLPIKGNTISLTRNVHVFIYLVTIALSLSFLSIIVAIYKFGFFSGLIYLFTIFLNVLFTLFLANILYLGIMRIASGERVKNILMYFQIFMAIFFMGGYQIAIRMVDRVAIVDMVLSVHWYTYLLPPAFFSGLIEALTMTNFDQSHLIFIAEALLLPPIAIYFTGKFLTPVFNRKLIDLEQGDRVSKVNITHSGKSLWYCFMSSIFVSRPDEKAAFRLIWKMTGRERQFKQTFFPSIGIIIIIIAMQFLNKHSSLSQMTQGDNYLLLLYFCTFVAVGLVTSLRIGNNQQAVWIYRTVPMKTPADFFKGSIKAAFSRFFIPVYLVISSVICAFWGIKVLPDVIIALLSIYLITSIYYYFQDNIFPFTQEKAATQGGAATIKILFLMFLVVPLGFLHRFMLHWFDYANFILIPLYSVAILYVNRVMVYRKITWRAVDLVNNYS